MELPLPDGRQVDTVLSDEEVVRRVVAGEPELFELLMRRHNQRLFRTVRGLVGDDAAAEEALQRAYVAAWRGLAQYAGRASFATWMTRIALRSAGEFARREQRKREVVEASADALPEPLRIVVVLRLVEGLGTAEVAEALDLSEANVKVRLHRAREQLKEDLIHVAEREGLFARTWAFDGARCDRMVGSVLRSIRALEP
jgi:RNA polymerase sigma-70 factor (ECF subfamily)